MRQPSKKSGRATRIGLLSCREEVETKRLNGTEKWGEQRGVFDRRNDGWMYLGRGG